MSLAAIAKKLPEVADGATILTFCYDTGERYLSVDGLFLVRGNDNLTTLLEFGQSELGHRHVEF